MIANVIFVMARRIEGIQTQQGESIQMRIVPDMLRLGHVLEVVDYPAEGLESQAEVFLPIRRCRRSECRVEVAARILVGVFLRKRGAIVAQRPVRGGLA